MSHYAHVKYEPGDPITDAIVQAAVQAIKLNKRGDKYTPPSYLLTNHLNKVVFAASNFLDMGLHELDEKDWKPALAAGLSDNAPEGSIELITKIIQEFKP